MPSTIGSGYSRNAERVQSVSGRIADYGSFVRFVEQCASGERLRQEMLLAFEVFTVFVTAVTMSLALAHALEFPGKLRLDEQTYTAVQAIYYPGFTIGGVAEPIAAIAVLILLLILRDRTAQFWWLLLAFVSLTAVQAVFWSVTQRVNRFWLKNQNLSKAGTKFFNTESIKGTDRIATGADWRHLRDRWEYSHLIRAVLSSIAFIAITVVVATR